MIKIDLNNEGIEIERKLENMNGIINLKAV